MSSDASVVVPVRNGARFVHACWENLNRQSLAPREVIFVDDGSSDGTRELLDSLAEAEPRVVVLSQSPAGPAAARNLGIGAARGSVIAFLDIDDKWADSALERMIRGFELNPQVSIVAGLVQICWAGQAPHPDSPLARPHRRVNLGAHAFRAEVFRSFGLFDSTLMYGEDLEYLARLRHARVPFHQLEEVTLFYYQHGENMTSGRGVHQLGLFEALSRSLQRERGTKVDS